MSNIKRKLGQRKILQQLECIPIHTTHSPFWSIKTNGSRAKSRGYYFKSIKQFPKKANMWGLMLGQIKQTETDSIFAFSVWAYKSILALKICISVKALHRTPAHLWMCQTIEKNAVELSAFLSWVNKPSGNIVGNKLHWSVWPKLNSLFSDSHRDFVC